MSDAAAEAPVSDNQAHDRRTAISAPRVLITLIRRELWEHRAMWIVPLLLSALIVLSAFLSYFGTGGFSRNGPFPWSAGAAAPSQGDPRAVGIALFGLRQWALSVPLYLSATVILYFYLLSSLFDERKDRSILFWKSLPVSDAATVGSKLLVAMLVVPLGIFALALVDHLLFVAIWNARALAGSLIVNPFVWDTVAWLKVEAFLLTSVVMSVLWYAPVTAYLLLISAWARRNPFLWAVLPPLILAVVERVAFGTTYVWSAFTYRLSGIWKALGFDSMNRATVSVGRGHLPDLARMFDTLDFGRLCANTDLWAGLIIAGALAYAAGRVRRYRDDT